MQYGSTASRAYRKSSRLGCEAVYQCTGLHANTAMHGIGWNHKAIAGYDIKFLIINSKNKLSGFYKGGLNVGVMV